MIQCYACIPTVLSPGLSTFLLPHTLLEDVFECVTIDIAEAVFAFMETHVATWTQVQRVDMHA